MRPYLDILESVFKAFVNNVDKIFTHRFITYKETDVKSLKDFLNFMAKEFDSGKLSPLLDINELTVLNLIFTNVIPGHHPLNFISKTLRNIEMIRTNFEILRIQSSEYDRLKYQWFYYVPKRSGEFASNSKLESKSSQHQAIGITRNNWFYFMQIMEETFLILIGYLKQIVNKDPNKENCLIKLEEIYDNRMYLIPLSEIHQLSNEGLDMIYEMFIELLIGKPNGNSLTWRVLHSIKTPRSLTQINQELESFNEKMAELENILTTQGSK